MAHGPLVIISLENLPIATCQMQPRKDIGSCLKFKVLLKENEGKRDLIILNVHLIQAEVLYSNSGMILQL